jgi:hypothetical protein
MGPRRDDCKSEISENGNFDGDADFQTNRLHHRDTENIVWIGIG